MKTSHQFARELLAGPDLPICHFDPSRAGLDDESDTSLSEPKIERVTLDAEDIAAGKDRAEDLGRELLTDFLTINGETDEEGEAMSRTESDRLNALKMLNDRVHNMNYDFNADPDRMTLIVSAAINGEPRPE